MITPHTAAPESRTRLRRFVSIGLVLVGVVMLVAVAAWLFLPSSVPPVRLVGWKLDYGYGGPAFDPATAQTTTVIPVEVEWPACVRDPGGLSWLATPVVTYTPVSATIQLRMTDTAAATCAASDVIGWYTSGLYLPVHLSEPLGGRALFDGSSSPPAARLYP